MTKEICLTPSSIMLTLIIVLLIPSFALYTYHKMSTQSSYSNLSAIKNFTPEPVIKRVHDNARFNFLEKYPERQYIGQYDYSLSSRPVGYIYDSKDRFPLFENRLGRNFYYHTLDDSRNGIRIVLSVPKNEMLYDGEIINSQELGGDYVVKMYDNSGNLYNPFQMPLS